MRFELIPTGMIIGTLANVGKQRRETSFLVMVRHVAWTHSARRRSQEFRPEAYQARERGLSRVGDAHMQVAAMRTAICAQHAYPLPLPARLAVPQPDSLRRGSPGTALRPETRTPRPEGTRRSGATWSHRSRTPTKPAVGANPSADLGDLLGQHSFGPSFSSNSTVCPSPRNQTPRGS